MNILQKEFSANISNLKVWLDANELTLNLDKAAFLFILPPSTNKNLNLNQIFADKLIRAVSSCKYLGVYIH